MDIKALIDEKLRRIATLENEVTAIDRAKENKLSEIRDCRIKIEAFKEVMAIQKTAGKAGGQQESLLPAPQTDFGVVVIDEKTRRPRQISPRWLGMLKHVGALREASPSDIKLYLGDQVSAKLMSAQLHYYVKQGYLVRTLGGYVLTPKGQELYSDT